MPDTNVYRYLKQIQGDIGDNFRHIRIYSRNVYLTLRMCREIECPYCTAMDLAIFTMNVTMDWSVSRKRRGTKPKDTCPRLICEGHEIHVVRSISTAENIEFLTRMFLHTDVFIPQSHQLHLSNRVASSTDDGHTKCLVEWSMGSGKTEGAVYSVRSIPQITVACGNTMIDYWIEKFMSIHPIVDRWDIKVYGYHRFESELYDDPDLVRGRALIIDECQYYKNYHQKSEHKMGMPEVIRAAADTPSFLLLLSGTPLVHSYHDLAYIIRLLGSSTEEEEYRVENQSAEKSTTLVSQILKVLDPMVPSENHSSLLAHVRSFLSARDRVHSFSPQRGHPDFLARHYPILIEEEPFKVPMTWPQVLNYFWTTRAKVTVNGTTFLSSSKGGMLSKLAIGASTELNGTYFSSKNVAILRELAARRVRHAMDDRKDIKTRKRTCQQVVYSGLHARTLLPLFNQIKREYPEWNVVMLDGKTGPELRQATVESFKREEIDVLLICRVGMVGLDLPGSATVIIVEPQLNTMTERQIFARAIRFTSDLPVPKVVNALRMVATFPKVQGEINIPTEERNTIRKWHEAQPFGIQDAFSTPDGEIQSDPVIGVINWLRQCITETSLTTDEVQHQRNIDGWLQLQPFIDMLQESTCCKIFADSMA